MFQTITHVVLDYVTRSDIIISTKNMGKTFNYKAIRINYISLSCYLKLFHDLFFDICEAAHDHTLFREK